MATMDLSGDGTAAGDSVPQHPLSRPGAIVAWESARSVCEDSAQSAMRWAGSDQDFDDPGLRRVEASLRRDQPRTRFWSRDPVQLRAVGGNRRRNADGDGRNP